MRQPPWSRGVPPWRRVRPARPARWVEEDDDGLGVSEADVLGTPEEQKHGDATQG